MIIRSLHWCSDFPSSCVSTQDLSALLLSSAFVTSDDARFSSSLLTYDFPALSVSWFFYHNWYLQIPMNELLTIPLQCLQRCGRIIWHECICIKCCTINCSCGHICIFKCRCTSIAGCLLSLRLA